MEETGFNSNVSYVISRQKRADPRVEGWKRSYLDDAVKKVFTGILTLK